MGDVRPIYTRCPLCGQVFPHLPPGSYVTVGRESDLCPRFPGRQSDAAKILQREVTMCPACGFAAPENFEEVDLSFDERYELEERLAGDGMLRVFKSNPTPWLPFHAAELCGRERDFSHFRLGDICLRASWVCRKERQQPFESSFQHRAVRHFMRALDTEPLDWRELPLTTYLIGELNRRLGHHRDALNWFVNAERMIGNRPELAWLNRLISEQRKLAESAAA
ncbi:DUF2225 domain-containing protein [Rubrobacter taiwanensis]|jgi:uncharacterized protein (DUF2225 family)|nr:DUF2225 domain-containing protein [Rubrobacter taiwanensis]